MYGNTSRPRLPPYSLPPQHNMSTQHSLPPQHTLPPIHGATSPHGIQPQHPYSSSSHPPPAHHQRHPAPLSLATQNSEALNYSNYSASAHPPPSPSQSSEVADDGNYNLPEVPPVSRIWRNYVWALQIVQQPIRARMCGFGDKVSTLQETHGHQI